MNQPASPWALSVQDVLVGLETSSDVGLTEAEAAARLERNGPNELIRQQRTPDWRRFAAQFADPVVYLLAGAAGVSAVAWVIEGADDAPIEAVVVLLIVILNGVLGYVQEERADNAVAALQAMTAATTTVLCDGETERRPAADLVPGDVLILSEGDLITADARVLSAVSLTLNEAALTGESQPVWKSAEPVEKESGLADRTNMVFSGTSVSGGHGRGLVTSTGMSTEMGRIAELLEGVSGEPTPLQREVARIGRALGLAVVIIAVVVIGAILLTADLREPSDYVDVLLIGVSLAVAAVPEGSSGHHVNSPGSRPTAHGQAANAGQAVVVCRDARVGLGGMHRQDRNPHAKLDDHRGGADTFGPGRPD